MNEREFIKSKKATKYKDVAFTKKEKETIFTWMRQYAKHVVKEDEKQRRKCLE